MQKVPLKVTKESLVALADFFSEECTPRERERERERDAFVTRWFWSQMIRGWTTTLPNWPSLEKVHPHRVIMFRVNVLGMRSLGQYKNYTFQPGFVSPSLQIRLA
jgi:hypothetical protein